MKKRIVILGAGESGAGSAVLAIKQGFDVFVSDSGTIKPEYREILDKHKIRYEEGKHTEGNMMKPLYFLPMRLLKARGFLRRLR
jgi:UDP-N-acetylmuramoylalanine--D-glutamate ligase